MKNESIEDLNKKITIVKLEIWTLKIIVISLAGMWINSIYPGLGLPIVALVIFSWI